MTAQVVVGDICAVAGIDRRRYSLACRSSVRFCRADRESAGRRRPDVDHNYGHNRYETVASLFLGGLLIAVGAGMLWRAVETNRESSGYSARPFVRAYCGAHRTGFEGSAIPLYAARRKACQIGDADRQCVACAFRRRVFSRRRARHYRQYGRPSGCSIRLRRPIVGFMVGSMGWRFGWDALQDLSDRALDQATADDLRAIVAEHARRARSARIAHAENGRSRDRRCAYPRRSADFRFRGPLHCRIGAARI